jgi:pimeloyl-ACP methyl ester carboxylesterase
MRLKLSSHAESFRYKGSRLLGVYAHPVLSKKVPAVLFLHGFPGSEKNVDIQRALLTEGIASFALHFAGAWGSGGLYRISTLVGQAQAALRFLAKKKEIDAARMGVFGFSMGAWTALHLAARTKSLKAVAAVAPVGGKEMIAPGLKSFVEKSSKVLNVGSTEALYRDFVRTVSTGDPAACVKKTNFPVMIVHAKDDEVVPYAVSEKIRSGRSPHLTFVPSFGGGHSFLDRRPWLTRQVSSWFRKYL